METSQKLTLLAITVGAATSIFVTLLTGMPLFKFYPNYEVNIESSSNNTLQVEKLLLKNKEIVQAKSASAFIFSEDDIEVNSFENCIEGKNQDFSSKKIQKINFDRISQNIPCQIIFSSSPTKDINKIMITSEESPGKIYVPMEPIIIEEIVNDDSRNETNNSTDNSLDGLSYLIKPIFAQGKIEVIKETKFVPFKLQQDSIESIYQLVMWGGIIESVLLSGILSIKFLRNYRKQIELKKQREVFQEEADEIQRELTKLESDKEIDNNEKDQIIQLTRENISTIRKIQEIESMISSDLMYHSLIGQFFEKWIAFENNLYDLAGVNNIEIFRRNTKLIVMKLGKLEVLSPFFIERFEKLRQFRNHLAHGTIKKSKKEIKLRIQELENLHGEILEIMSEVNKDRIQEKK